MNIMNEKPLHRHYVLFHSWATAIYSATKWNKAKRAPDMADISTGVGGRCVIAHQWLLNYSRNLM